MSGSPQTTLTAITSAAMARYSVVVDRDQRALESSLILDPVLPEAIRHGAIPLTVARWAGLANAAVMVLMTALWAYVGCIR